MVPMKNVYTVLCTHNIYIKRQNVSQIEAMSQSLRDRESRDSTTLRRLLFGKWERDANSSALDEQESPVFPCTYIYTASETHTHTQTHIQYSLASSGMREDSAIKSLRL